MPYLQINTPFGSKTNSTSSWKKSVVIFFMYVKTPEADSAIRFTNYMYITSVSYGVSSCAWFHCKKKTLQKSVQWKKIYCYCDTKLI